MTPAPPVPGPRRPRLRGVVAVLGALALSWLGGLLWFAHSIPDDIADGDSVTDAVIVLTGGSLRIEAGVALLAAGKAKKLFISGVHHGADVAAVLHGAGVAPDARLLCCIVLGYAADNTEGNAVESAGWMAREGFRSVRLVTSSYHMPRSLLEFSRAMPGVRIVPHPVFADRVKQGQWLVWPGTANLIVGEYEKYLLALARPIFRHGDAGADRAGSRAT